MRAHSQVKTRYSQRMIHFRFSHGVRCCVHDERFLPPATTFPRPVVDVALDFSRHLRPHAGAFFFPIELFPSLYAALCRARACRLSSPRVRLLSSAGCRVSLKTLNRRHARSRLPAQFSCAYPFHPVPFESWCVPFAKTPFTGRNNRHVPRLIPDVVPPFILLQGMTSTSPN